MTVLFPPLLQVQQAVAVQLMDDFALRWWRAAAAARWQTWCAGTQEQRQFEVAQTTAARTMWCVLQRKALSLFAQRWRHWHNVVASRRRKAARTEQKKLQKQLQEAQQLQRIAVDEAAARRAQNRSLIAEHGATMERETQRAMGRPVDRTRRARPTGFFHSLRRFSENSSQKCGVARISPPV